MQKTAASKVAWAMLTASMVFALAGCSGETTGSGSREEDEKEGLNMPAKPPNAKDDHVSTVEGREVHVEMVANDSGRSLQIDRIKPGQAQHGDIICEAGIKAGRIQSCTYTPGEGFTGKDEFSYVVQDANGRSDSAMVYVRVKLAN